MITTIIIAFGILSLCWYIASFFYKNDFQEEVFDDIPERADKEEKQGLYLLPPTQSEQKFIDQCVPCSGEFPKYPAIYPSGVSFNIRSSYE